MKKRFKRPAYQQPTSDELLDSLLAFIQGRFYQGHPGAFAKDRKRLLAWVILWPAEWLTERGVTLPADRYRELVKSILLDALRHGTGKINYLPAWLRQTVQSHFAHHGDEIYEEAKSMRTLVEQAVASAAGRPQPARDPVADLAAAKRLLAVAKGQIKGQKRAVNAQLRLI